MMGKVAEALLGTPNERLSRPRDGVLRFGSHGSMEVSIRDGWFADHESDVRGGVLDLIKHKGGAANDAAAFRWLEERGIKEAAPLEGRQQQASRFYDYRDETGQTVFRVERKQRGQEKTFLQHGPDGAGGFHCKPGCMQGVRRVLYRLPELAAADPSEIVYYCEGERDADRLARDGLVATTHPGGAGKFDPVSHCIAEHLAGRRVVILQDNDEAGAKHAAAGLKKLSAVAERAISLLLPGLPPKGDVSDWLAAGGSAFELQQKAEAAFADADAPAELLQTLDLADLSTRQPVPKSFAIERLAPLAEVTLFTGPGSAGKSLLGQQMATCAAAGLPCLRLAVEPGPALYLTCEDDAEQLHWRQAHLCDALGVPMASLAGKLHLVSLRGALDNELGTFTPDGRMHLAPAYHRLVATLQSIGARLAFLDNVAHLFAGNENDRGDVTRFVSLLNRLASDTGAAIILLGHPNKSGDDYSGSTAWLNAVRSQFNIEHDVETDIRKLKIGKANYAQKGDAFRFMWRDWAFVHEDDLPADTARQMRETVLANADNKLFLTCLAERNKQRRHVSEKPTAQNFAPKVFEAMPESKGIGRKRLTDAMDRLFRIEAIERGFLWRDTGEGRDIHGLRETSDKPS
ncbi:AAA family ATPase [Novosphingobium sp. TW-4]|uniref:AAA family ATPase n=2 Tax=Novosphingobium olei TaxID=2728851 RepID=A0A7Y0GB85_9SPHN|nr:AAA family ATPase [Novosphingobium olei]